MLGLAGVHIPITGIEVAADDAHVDLAGQRRAELEDDRGQLQREMRAHGCTHTRSHAREKAVSFLQRVQSLSILA